MIKINQLLFEYGRKRIFDDFTLHIQNSGVYGLFGHNGSGKSTLLKLISGLLFPHAGSLMVGGFVPAQRYPDFLASVYIVPEEFHLPNISLARLLTTQSAFYPNFSHSNFNEYVEIFEVPTDKSFEFMSLGQKKKAVMAFALATHTPILLMDEPTNGLDILGRAQFKAILARPEHADRVVIISTHQAHDLESLMSHVLFVDEGRLALSSDMTILRNALIMGVTDDAATVPALIYQEQLGQQTTYVAANLSGVASPIHLELLYKALSLQKNGILMTLHSYHDNNHQKNGSAV